MGEHSRRVCFSITGDFVTKTARDWMWREGKPWSTVEEFLLSCMCGTDQTREELVDLAIKVVTGKAKFIGNTADDTYALVEDNQDLIGENIGRWSRRLKELEKDRRELEDKYFQLTGFLIDSGRGYLLKQAGVEHDEKDDLDDGFGSMLLDSFMKQDRIEREGHKENYGWLDPQGNFYPVEYCDHQEWAFKEIQKRGWGEEYRKSDDDICLWGAGDFLTAVKGWALLHNPGRGVAYVTSSDTKPLTKAQREFLYGYYIDRGLTNIAELYMED